MIRIEFIRAPAWNFATVLFCVHIFEEINKNTFSEKVSLQKLKVMFSEQFSLQQIDF